MTPGRVLAAAPVTDALELPRAEVRDAAISRNTTQQSKKAGGGGGPGPANASAGKLRAGVNQSVGVIEMLDGFIHEPGGKTETQARARVRARQPSRNNKHSLLLRLFFSCERKTGTEITGWLAVCLQESNVRWWV